MDQSSFYSLRKAKFINIKPSSSQSDDTMTYKLSPSKKAETFKQSLAKVVYERVQEIENPELGQDCIRSIIS